MLGQIAISRRSPKACIQRIFTNDHRFVGTAAHDTFLTVAHSSGCVLEVDVDVVHLQDSVRLSVWRGLWLRWRLTCVDLLHDGSRVPSRDTLVRALLQHELADQSVVQEEQPAVAGLDDGHVPADNSVTSVLSQGTLLGDLL